MTFARTLPPCGPVMAPTPIGCFALLAAGGLASAERGSSVTAPPHATVRQIASVVLTKKRGGKGKPSAPRLVLLGQRRDGPDEVLDAHLRRSGRTTLVRHLGAAVALGSLDLGED